MSFKELIKKVEASQEYKKFKKAHKKAILYSAFFLVRQAAGNLILESRQLDYWFGEENVATFSIDEENKLHHKIDKLEKKGEFKELDCEIKVDIEEIKKIILKELKKNCLEIQNVSKIIIVLQQIENKQVWNITCLVGFTMIRMHVDMTGKILESKKGSLFDMMQVKKGEKKS